MQINHRSMYRTRQKLRVYAVDDEAVLRAFIRVSLNRIEGIELYIANNEDLFYNLLRSSAGESFDVYVLDGEFPGNGAQPRGVAVAKKLMKNRTQEDRIFFVSGSREYLDMARESGLTRLYTKRSDKKDGERDYITDLINDLLNYLEDSGVVEKFK